MTRGQGGTGGVCHGWLRLATALLAGLLLLAPTAAAAPAPATEDHAFPAPESDTVYVNAAFAPNGFAAAAWIEKLANAHYRVGVSLRPPGGDWSAPQFMGETDRFASDVRVAVNDSGAAVLGWGESQSPSTFVGDVSTRPAGGSFGTPETFAGGSGVAVGIDAAGNATVVYQVVNQMPTTLNGVFTRTFPAGTSFAAPTPDTLGSTCRGNPQLAVAPSGDAVTGWDCSSVLTAIRRNGTWGPTTTAYQTTFENCPTGGGGNLYYLGGVAIDPQGHAAAVVVKDVEVRDCSGLGFNQTTHSIELAVPAGGALAAGPTVAQGDTGFGFFPPANDVSQPTVAIGGGSVVVSWLQLASFTGHPMTRTYPGNGADSPGAAQPVGDPGVAGFAPRVVVAPYGQVLVSWITAPTSGHSVAMATYRPVAGTFGAALPVSDGAADAGVTANGIDDAGDGLIAFLEGPNTGPRTAHARGFDANPPQLHDVSIPASADLGTSLPFLAQASDVWGPVTFAWDFGDGTAADATTTHAFAAAGPHTVTVTATDAAGSSSQSGPVTVNAPPAPVPPAAGPRAPVLSALSMTNAKFRVGARATAISAARKRKLAPTGTTFRFTLDEAASTVLEIDRALPGRRSGRRCVKPTRRLAKKKRCTRYASKGRLTRAAKAGKNSVAFSGRIGRRALAPGSYRVTFVASASGLAGQAKTLRFKIVR